MKDEFSYYAALSGLSPAAQFSLADHKLAYWRTEAGISTGTLADAEMAFLRGELVEQPYESLSDLRYRYFSALSGLSPAAQFSIADHQLVIFAGGGGPPPGSLTGTFLQGAGDSADLTTYTFAAQNLGPASADRVIVIAASGRQATAQTIVSVTIGGVSATEIGTRGSSTNPLGIWRAAVPTGTTGDVVVTFSGAMLRAQIVAWAVTGGAAALSSAATGTSTATVTGVTGGFIIAVANNTGATSFTWTNATERSDLGQEAGLTTSGADATTVGSTLLTATPGAPSANGIVAVALSP